MTFIEHLQLLQRMNDLIRRKATGKCREFARRLRISVATLFRRFEELRTMGAKIEYCDIRQSYFYSNQFDFKYSTL
jgi:predicted DNA-binding transcriptional regulator YafY